VRVACDDGVPYADLIAAMDCALAAGLRDLSVSGP